MKKDTLRATNYENHFPRNAGEDPEHSQETPRPLPGSPEGAPEKLPGAFKAPLGLPFGHLGGSCSSKINDLEAFLSENHVPEVEENEEFYKKGHFENSLKNLGFS